MAGAQGGGSRAHRGHHVLNLVVGQLQHVLEVVVVVPGRLAHQHGQVEDENVPDLGLASIRLLVGYDLKLAVFPQPAVNLQVRRRPAPVHDAVLDLPDDVQLLGIPLGFVDVVGHVHHRMVSLLDWMVLFVGEGGLSHQLVQQQVVLEDSLHRHRQKVPQPETAPVGALFACRHLLGNGFVLNWSRDSVAHETEKFAKIRSLNPNGKLFQNFFKPDR